MPGTLRACIVSVIRWLSCKQAASTKHPSHTLTPDSTSRSASSCIMQAKQCSAPVHAHRAAASSRLPRHCMERHAASTAANGADTPEPPPAAATAAATAAAAGDPHATLRLAVQAMPLPYQLGARVEHFYIEPGEACCASEHISRFLNIPLVGANPSCLNT